MWAKVERQVARTVVACVVAAGFAVLVPAPARASALEVNSVADADDPLNDGLCRTAAGECTLRAALTEAKRQPGRDVISFNIPGPGPFVITPSSPLPSLTDLAGTVLDGYSQPGASANTSPTADNAVLKIQIVGPGPNTFPGLLVNSPNNVFRGLSIRGFKHNIYLYGPLATGNKVVGNFIGTDPSGTATATVAAPGNSGVTLQAGASANIIGTPDLADRNVLSGNYQHGVAAYDNTTDGNIVQNNIIGMAPSGTRRLGNLNHGVDLNTWSTNALIGGPGAGEGNVLSGNYNTGVEISHGEQTLGNKIIGNVIGADVTGAATPESVNNQFGVRLEGAASCDICGLDAGDATVSGNIVVNNQKGGVLADKGFHDSVISNNRIGVLADGSRAPNGNFGVRVAHGATRITVGPGNIIAGHPNGVQIDVFGISPENLVSTPTNQITVTRNAIYDNGLSLGIDLTPLGAANSVANADPNANEAVQAPVLGVVDAGHVTGAACAGCMVEVFEADAAALRVGSGKRYIGRAAATAAGTFSVALDAEAAGKVVTATATLPTGGTSEFARNKDVPAAAAVNTPPSAVGVSSCDRVTCSFAGTSSSDPDGSVVGYVWDFGDGTEVTQGQTPTHTYTRSGSYTVSLTVVDDGGARATTTINVVAVNLPPVAVASVTCLYLVCSYDGSASSDSDGTVRSYVWAFGDGTTGTGPTTTHTYALGQPVTATLTVTDDLGATAVTTTVVTPSNPPAGRVGEDAFGRTTTSGWGSATVGGPYSYGGGSADLSVSGGVGRITVRTSGGTRSAFLGGNRRDCDQRVTFTTGTTPTGNGESVSVVSRSTASNVNYRGRVRLAGDGTVRAAVTKAVGGNEVVVGAETTVPGLTFTAGTRLTVRMLTQGVSPTTLSVKVWRADSPEPPAWSVVRTDTDPALAGPGGYGLLAFVSPSMTSVPVVFIYDDYAVDAVNIPPTAAGAVSCAHRTCTFTSSSTDVDGTIASYVWDFGDGVTATTASATHDYATIDPRTAVLTVTDNSGGTATTSVEVGMTTLPPVAVAALSCVKLTCTADSTGSADPDGSISSYTWEWSDGSISSGATSSHTFGEAGPVSVQLSVTDDDGTTGTAVATGVTAGNQGPTAAATVSCTVLTCAVNGSGSTDPDGRIVAYAWDFGDGATGDGVSATHTYSASGSVTITLTVTDDDGATAQFTMTATPAENRPPNAVLDVTCVRLTCSATAAGSADPDGTIVSYAWDLGDTVTATGQTVTRTYPSGGPRTVTLTVTDDRGATASATQDINPQPAVLVYASDAFTRTTTNGWGAATSGGAWTVSSTPSNFAVADGVGTVTLAAAGTGRSVWLGAVSRTDSDTAVTVSFDKVATGFGDFASVIGRRVATNQEYRARLRVSGTSAYLALVRLSGSSTETLIGPETKLGLVYAAGSKITVRLQVTGTGVTQLQAKAWLAGAAEPATWTVTGTDTTAALQAAGAVGLHTQLSSSVTNAPVVTSFTAFSARTTQPVG